MTTTNSIEIVVDSTEQILNNNIIEIEYETPTCRICLETQLEYSDPLLVLGCACRGGIAQGHKNCLTKWFCQQRYTSIFTIDGSPDYRKCEICGENLSYSTQKVINVHWMSYLKDEMVKNIILANDRMMARQEAQDFRMTWRDFGYFILGIIFIIVLVGGWNKFNPELS